MKFTTRLAVTPAIVVGTLAIGAAASATSPITTSLKARDGDAKVYFDESTSDWTYTNLDNTTCVIPSAGYDANHSQLTEICHSCNGQDCSCNSSYQEFCQRCSNACIGSDCKCSNAESGAFLEEEKDQKDSTTFSPDRQGRQPGNRGVYPEDEERWKYINNNYNTCTFTKANYDTATSPFTAICHDCQGNECHCQGQPKLFRSVCLQMGPSAIVSGGKHHFV